MHPYLWIQQTETGPIHYGTYGLMLTLAFLLAAVLTGARMRKVGINPEVVVPMMVVAIISSILGSRLLHFLGSPGDRGKFFENPLILFDVTQGGMAVLGGLIAGVLAGGAFLKWRGVPVMKAADIAATTIPIGLAIGRVGCFFAGCCHGRSCDLPATGSLTGALFQGGEIVTVAGFPFVAFSYHAGVGMAAIHEIPLFPTQGWEILIWGSAALAFGWVWKNHRYFDGQLMAMLMVAYPVFRGIIELFRGDAVRGTGYTALELSTSQVAAIPVFAAALILVAVQARKGVAPEQEIVYDDALDDLDDYDDEPEDEGALSAGRR